MLSLVEFQTRIVIKVYLFSDAGSTKSLLANDCLNDSVSTINCENNENQSKMDIKSSMMEKIQQELTCNVNFFVQNNTVAHAQTTIPSTDPERATATLHVNVDGAKFEFAEMNDYQHISVGFIFSANLFVNLFNTKFIVAKLDLQLLKLFIERAKANE